MKNIIEQLEKLAELKDKGILTEDEFQEQKTKVLNQHKGEPPLMVKTPQTPNTNADRKNLIKFLVAIFFAIMVVFLIKSCDSNKSSAKNTPNTPSVQNDSEILIKGFAEFKARFDTCNIIKPAYETALDLYAQADSADKLATNEREHALIERMRNEVTETYTITVNNANSDNDTKLSYKECVAMDTILNSTSESK